jgi:hypothetical protein
VPIVEPEVLMHGRHTIARCDEVTSTVLHAVFSALFEQRVDLEEMLLKPNMVIAGGESPQQATVAEVATSTLRVLRRHAPAAVAGIVFLSGGQHDIEATRHLDAINRAPGTKPWAQLLYGRALGPVGDVARYAGERSGRATRVLSPRALQRSRLGRRVHGRRGAVTNSARGIGTTKEDERATDVRQRTAGLGRTRDVDGTLRRRTSTHQRVARGRNCDRGIVFDHGGGRRSAHAHQPWDHGRWPRSTAARSLPDLSVLDSTVS